jgi:methyl-accepting chemotaxis protein
MLGKFKLGTKFTLLLVGIFILGSMVGGVVLSNALQHKAEDQITAQGLMLMQTVDSIKNYTNVEVRPLMEASLSPDDFLPQTVPSYSSRKVFETLKTNSPQFQNYLYKDAVINPTNPHDQADSFEMNLIQEFQTDPRLEEVSDFRDLPGEGMVFYSARPLAIRQASCLRCHGVPEDAPPSMIASYGRDNGFGWKLDSVVGAQIVYVPAEKVFQQSQRSFSTVMSIFIGVFAIAILLLNWLLNPTVIQPVRYLARVSQRLGTGEMAESDQWQLTETSSLDKVANRRDELGQLARIFRTMVQEVIAREQFLKQQVKALKIEIDESRRDREVAEITNTDYFADLQKKAKQLRRRSQQNDTPPADAQTPDDPPAV